MNVVGYVTGAAKACLSAIKAIDELAKRARSREKRRAIVEAIGAARSPRASILMASLVYGQGVTYADILHNLVFMVEIRTGMVMRLERALSKSDLTQTEINDACRDVYDFIVDLKFSISQLHGLLAQIEDDDMRAIPISLGVVLAESEVYADELIAELGYDEKTRDNRTDIFSNPSKRKMLEHLCTEMKRMIDLLCNMPIGDGPGKKRSIRKVRHSPVGRRRDGEDALRVDKLSLADFERRLADYGFEVSPDKAAQAFEYFKKHAAGAGDDQGSLGSYELNLIAEALDTTIEDQDENSPK